MSRTTTSSITYSKMRLTDLAHNSSSKEKAMNKSLNVSTSISMRIARNKWKALSIVWLKPSEIRTIRLRE
jgi:hypothetical protein